MPISFRFRLIPLLCTLILCVLGIVLGQWQTRRAAEKEGISIALMQKGKLPALTSVDLNSAAKDLAFRRVTLNGEFVSDWPLYLDNRPMHGVAGFFVLMPFKIQGGNQHVMIVRGWQPRNPISRTQMPLLKTPKGVIEVNGVIRVGVDKVMQLGQNEQLKPGAIIQNLDVNDVGRQIGLPIYSFVLDQTNDSSDGLLRDWSLPSGGADKHRAYAFQWYALSLMAIIFFVVTGFRRGKRK